MAAPLSPAPAPAPTTIGRLEFERLIPSEHRAHLAPDAPIETKAVRDILQHVADTHPERYRDLSQKLLRLGNRGAVETDSSFGLEDLRAPIDTEAVRQKLRQDEDAVFARRDLSVKQKQNELVKLYGRVSNDMPDRVYQAALGKGSNLARMVQTGARGNRQQLNSNVGMDGLVIDAAGDPVPIALDKSYAEGLTPAQYFASSYGTRQGLISTKFAVADSGFLSKQLAAANQDLIVTAHDCGTKRGLPVEVQDRDSVGSLLAKNTGQYKLGEMVTPKMLKDLEGAGVKRLLVRSPITCGQEHGICAHCAGVREFGTLPELNANLGLAASGAVGEPLSQGLLCLAEDTEVRMADWSTKKIQDVQVGEFVLGCDIDGNTFPSPVVACHDNGTKECYRTEFTRGRKRRDTLVSTLDHKILARWRKYTCAGESLNHTNQILPVGYKTAEFFGVLPNHYRDKDLPDEPGALFLGLILGDGCCTESVGGVYFSSADPSLIEETENQLAEINLKITKLDGHDYYHRVSQISRHKNPRCPITGKMLSGTPSDLKKLAVRFGILGKYAHEKTIPAEAYGWSNQAVAALIGGLFITDGSVYLTKQIYYVNGEKDMHIGFGSTSKAMVDSLIELLRWRFGIYAVGPYQVDVTEKKWAKRPAWTFSIAANDSVRKFVEKIPMFGIKRRKISSWKQHLDKPCNVQAKQLRRVSQVFVGSLPTYDLEVAHPDHLFVLANDLVVSNSSKHSAGVANAGKGSRTTGFQAVNQLVQVPKVFKGGATAARHDGKVTAIEPAPTGGYFVHVDDGRGEE